MGVDLKNPDGVETVLRLVEKADGLIEGFRPGVTERLGIGPDDCRAVNPRLVYGRMTGWGRTGPRAHTAGHDITYLATSGVLHAIGTPDEPVPPLNLLGDFGGGGMLLAVGVLAALWRARETGQGQVVDASIVDGTALLATQVYGLLHGGLWRDERAANLLDGAAPNYGVYRTADGYHLAVGALEPRFWAEFTARLGGGFADADPYDRAGWPELRARVAERLASRTRDEWLAAFDGSDACVAPVLGLADSEAGLVTKHGVPQPPPAPRFSDTPAGLTLPPPRPGEHTREALTDWDVPDPDALIVAGVAVQG